MRSRNIYLSTFIQDLLLQQGWYQRGFSVYKRMAEKNMKWQILEKYTIQQNYRITVLNIFLNCGNFAASRSSLYVLAGPRYIIDFFINLVLTAGSTTLSLVLFFFWRLWPTRCEMQERSVGRIPNRVLQSRNPEGYFWHPFPKHAFNPESGPDFALKSRIPSFK